MPKLHFYEGSKGKISAGKNHLPSGTSIAHWHDYYELEIILSGEATHILNNTSMHIKRGDAYLLTPLDFHQFCEKTEMELLNTSFSEDYLPEEIAPYITSLTSGIIYHFTEEELCFVEQLLMRLNREIVSNHALKNIVCHAILSQLLTPFIREANKHIITIPQQMQRASAYIYKNFRQNLLISDLAAHLGLSPNYCGNLFTKTFGVSFNTYLQQVRLKYAGRLLSSSNTPIAEIAIAAGFRSVEYFNWSFKKYLGLSPSTYRQVSQNV